jgi:hypothetical protein
MLPEKVTSPIWRGGGGGSCAARQVASVRSNIEKKKLFTDSLLG